MKDVYGDIINLPYVKKERKISEEMRAAQFAPFAALSGYGNVIKETQRIKDSKPELDEERLESINACIESLYKKQHLHPKVNIGYFTGSKEDARFKQSVSTVKCVEPTQEFIELKDCGKIRFEDIYTVFEVSEEEK